MSLLKVFVRTLVNIVKFLVGVCGTQKIYSFYRDSVNHFSSLKTEVNDQAKKIIKMCSLALTNVLLLFFAIIIFSLGAINFLNDYFNSVYIGNLCIGCFILFVILIINFIKKS